MHFSPFLFAFCWNIFTLSRWMPLLAITAVDTSNKPTYTLTLTNLQKVAHSKVFNTLHNTRANVSIIACGYGMSWIRMIVCVCVCASTDAHFKTKNFICSASLPLARSVRVIAFISHFIWPLRIAPKNLPFKWPLLSALYFFLALCTYFHSIATR